jgi:hypothetical protein
MTKAIVCSLISMAIFGVMQTPSEAGDCYFNSTTYEPPDFARCYDTGGVATGQWAVP